MTVAIRLFLFACLAFAAGASAMAQAPAPQEESQPLDPAGQIDAIRDEIAGLRERLKGEDLRSDELLVIRTSAEALRARLQALEAELQPELTGIDTRLEQLGPPPAEGAPAESPEVTREREAQTTARQGVDELIRRANLLIVEASQTAVTATQMRRARFTGELFARRPSLASPDLWRPAVAGLPGDLSNLNGIAADLANRWRARLDGTNGGILGGALLVALLLWGPGRSWADRLGQRFTIAQVPPHRLRRSANALWVMLTTAAAPTAGALIALHGLRLSGLITDRLDPLAVAIVFAIGFIALVDGLARGILSPGKASWRLADVADGKASRIRLKAHTVSTVFALGMVVSELNRVVVTSAEASLLTDGLFALANALTFAFALRGLNRGAAQAGEAEQAQGAHPLLNGLRLLAWIAIFVIFAAVFSGYIAFGKFLTGQVIWIALLGAALYLLLALIDDLFTIGFSPDSGFARWARRATGLSAAAIEQTGVLLSGILRLTLVGIAILMAAAPWGIESYDAMGWLRAALFGFSVGSARFSLSTVFAAILVLLAGVLLTRLIQRWLDQRLMPKTSLDPGLQNSIRTGFGYFGVIMAAGFALSSLGLNLENVAIVAGALSVGIGFGLQSIVNNFVSGLILLAERPVKVGDWVQLGAAEGNIRKISVRATEIELFDRSTLIVPNADLISSQVTNKTHASPLGRVQIGVSTGYVSNPEQVRDILTACAQAHPDILREPAPQVLFSGFNTATLDFTLLAYVSSPRRAGLAKSDLHFAIHKAFTGAGIGIPLPDPKVRATEDIGRAIETLAASVSRSRPSSPES